MDGFARGGVLIFDIESLEGDKSVLSVLVAFRVRGWGGRSRRAFGRALGLLFPIYVHDVLWNHAMCELKHIVEMARSRPIPNSGQ